MDAETERALLAEYPYHIVVMVKAVEAAIEQGEATVIGGRLVFPAAAGAASKPKLRVPRRSTGGGRSEKLHFG